MEILIHQSISDEKMVKVAVSHLKILWCTDLMCGLHIQCKHEEKHHLQSNFKNFVTVGY